MGESDRERDATLYILSRVDLLVVTVDLLVVTIRMLRERESPCACANLCNYESCSAVGRR